MLRDNTVYGLAGIAERLTDAGVSLTPLAGSMLERQVTAAPHYALAVAGPTTAEINQNDAVVSEAAPYNLVAASKTANGLGLYVHDLALEANINEASIIVSNLIDFARNVAKPTVLELVGVVEQRLAGAISDAMTPVTIQLDGFHDIWSTPALDSLVSDFNEVPGIEVSFKKWMPLASPEAVVGYLRTGSTLFDEEVSSWLESVGESVVVNAYNVYLSEDTNLFPNTNNINQYTGDRETILALFLLAHHFNATKEVPEGVRASLSEYELFFAQLRTEMGRRVAAVLRTRDRERTSGKLVTSYPDMHSDKPVIRVNADNYNEWLSKGGEAEILLGAQQTDQERNPEALIVNGARYRAAYNQSQRLLNMKVRAENTTRTIEAIRFAIGSYIAQADDTTLPTSKAELQKIAARHIAALSEAHLTDLFRVVRRVVCRTLYAHTDAEKILVQIDVEAEANPGIEPADAALLATITIVTDWVASYIVTQA